MVHFGGGLVGEGILLWGFDLMLVQYIIYRTDQIHIYIYIYGLNTFACLVWSLHCTA